MIRRVVRMTFDPDRLAEFEQNFEDNKAKIRAFEGCEHLELWRDAEETNVFMTYSHWLSTAHLEAYRHPDLFKGIWSVTKPMFIDRPVAWSNVMVSEVVK